MYMNEVLYIHTSLKLSKECVVETLCEEFCIELFFDSQFWKQFQKATKIPVFQQDAEQAYRRLIVKDISSLSLYEN